MKFSLPTNAKDAGPHKYQSVMPPNTAGNKVASQGSKGASSGTPTFNSPRDHITGFHGAPASYTPKALQKPLYEKPKAR